MTRQEFAAKYYADVVKATQGTGILPETALSQMILESDAGNSQLSREANNFFGIKASSSWDGEVYYIKTKEYNKDGSIYWETAAFRKYPSVLDSIKGYVQFLQQNPRYAKAGVFNAKTVADQAAALKAAGYATDVNYIGLMTAVASQIKNVISETSKFASETANEAIIIAKRNKKLLIFGSAFLLLSVGVGFTILYKASQAKN